MFKNRLVFDNSSNTWHRWAGHYWAECRLNEQYDALVDVSQLLRQLATKHRKAHKTAAVTFTNGADSLQKLLMQNHVLQCATNGVNRLRISGDGWDQNGWLLGCPNGTLELDTGTFRPGRPEDYIKTICPTEYDPDATAPRWEQFIREIMPDPDIAAFLHRLLGYGITGRSTEHIFPVFWGESSRNGKGTLLETIGSVMGALAKPLPAKALMAQQFQESHDAQAMMLRGRRLLWGSETGDRQLLDTARVKQWTGGDSISGRAPYARTEVNFPATHKLVLLTNYKPRLSSDDKAMWNRMLLVPFRETFIDAPDAADPHQHLRDHELMDKLKGEKQGILRWLVQGCSDWHSIGLLPPKVIRAATASYQTEEDFLATFLAECTTPETEVLGNGASSKETYERFKSWSLLQGEKPIGQRRFLLSMDRRGVPRTHTRQGSRFIGFRLNDEGV
jgi:putative DNA primase/helicase